MPAQQHNRCLHAVLTNAVLTNAVLTNALACLWWLGFAGITWGQSPNVLFIISDDLTATALGSYGNPVVQTPNLDALAAAGVQFNHAYSQYPVCGPSRASMMTGIHPTALGATANGSSNFRSRHPGLVTLPQHFRQNGYTTARVSKIYHMGVPGDILNGTPGLDDPLSWDTTFNITGPEQTAAGFYEDLSPGNLGQGADFVKIESTEGDLAHADGMATTQAISLLGQLSGQDRPFFLAVGMVRPHVPLVAPEPYFAPYPHEDIVLPFVPTDDLDDLPSAATTQANHRKYLMNEEQQKKAVAAYYASVSYMDAQVGRLMDTLDQLEIRDDTIVVFTSDHGYNLGEHTMWQKLSLFEDTVRVPLIVADPAGAQGSTAGLVEMTDLYPTLAELAGVPVQDLPHGIHGESFAELVHDPQSTTWANETTYTITQGGAESIRTPRYRFNRWQDGSLELYDQVNDPQEFTNLAQDPSFAAVVTSLRGELLALRENASRIPDGPDPPAPSQVREVVALWDFEGVTSFTDRVGTADGMVTDNTSVTLGNGPGNSRAMRTNASISGSDDVVTIQSGTSFQPGEGPFSMSYWFRIADDGNTAPRGIFDFSGNGGDGAQSLYIGNTQELAFRVDGANGFSLAKIPMTEDDQWHFVAANFDPNGRLELHVDGLGIDASDHAQGVGAVAFDLAQFLGTFNFNGNTEDKGLNGWLDDLAVYRGLLTDAQIAGLFSRTLSPFDIVSVDFDGDGSVDCADIDALVTTIAAETHLPEMDLTGDGRVDIDDLEAWRVAAGNFRWGDGQAYLPGDGNLDGVVDVADFNIWNSHKFNDDRAWCSGDYNADGSVDVGDFNVWNSNKFRSSASGNPLPEPSPTVGLVGICLMVGRYRRPRSSHQRRRDVCRYTIN